LAGPERDAQGERRQRGDSDPAAQPPDLGVAAAKQPGGDQGPARREVGQQQVDGQERGGDERKRHDVPRRGEKTGDKPFSVISPQTNEKKPGAADAPNRAARLRRNATRHEGDAVRQ
jgi:hypothetical protein